jgi:hypothetical protein
MRCYFIKGGHIQAVEELPGLSDEQAVEKSHRLFAAKPEGRFDGFEVWERARVVLQWPPTELTAIDAQSKPDPS